MLIKNAPNKQNIKHVTANELTDDKNKRKMKRYKMVDSKSFTKYEDGQFERIFGEKKIIDK